MKIRRVFALLLTCVIILFGVMTVATEDSYAAARFGTRCEKTFENKWQKKLFYSFQRCDWFNNELDDTDTKVFYYNLHGAKSSFSTCDGCGAGVDNVHLLYVNTHGGAWSNDAVLTMWDENSYAQSNGDNWRFGDNDTKAAFFAQYACKTLQKDEKMYARWINTFKGGLIMALGSHDLLYHSITTNEVGEDFADGLQKSKKVKWAWFDGNADWATDQDVAVFASGSSQSGARDALADCEFRRDNVKWQNFQFYQRWRDSQVNKLCFHLISNN